jgi:hypothetical protein
VTTPGPQGHQTLGAAPWPRVAPTQLGVVDTDWLLNDLERLMLTGASDIEGLTNLGATRLFASRHVLDEMYQADDHGHDDKFHKLELQAALRQQDIPRALSRATFEERLLSRIYFVDPPTVRDDPRTLAVIHAQDIPTAELAVLLAPCNRVFSHDQHLRRPGVAAAELPTMVEHARTASDAHGLQVGLAMGLRFGSAVVSRGVDQVAAALRIRPRVIWLALIGLAAVLLLDPRRRARLEQTLGPPLERLGKAVDKGRDAQGRIEVFEAGEASLGRIDCKAARILALAEEPLLASELHRRLVQSAGEASLADTRSLLSEHPSFCQVSARNPRWQVGQSLKRAP